VPFLVSVAVFAAPPRVRVPTNSWSSNRSPFSPACCGFIKLHELIRSADEFQSQDNLIQNVLLVTLSGLVCTRIIIVVTGTIRIVRRLGSLRLL
jgi:hypothetical protein